MRRLDADVPHVWSSDPSLDTGAALPAPAADASDEEKKAHAEALAAKQAAFSDGFRKMFDEGDVSALPLKNGRRPVVWKLREPPGRVQADLCTDHPLDLSKPLKPQRRNVREWARHVIVGADGALGRNNGRALEFKTVTVPGGRALTEACIDEIWACYGPNCVEELAARGVLICELDPL
jgi:hypothetical protein